MERLTASLCPMCANCPEVTIDGDEVRIGEAGNLAILKREEWNVLVDLVQTGQLTECMPRRPRQRLVCSGSFREIPVSVPG
jgi:hypothetical protein